MKKLHFIVLFLIIASNSFGAEVQLSFSVPDGGGLTQSYMNTTSAGINGTITWTCDLPSYDPSLEDGRYDMSNLVDGYYGYNYGTGNNVHQSYWMAQDVRPEYLTIEFPEPVYITRIITYNVCWEDTQYIRFLESNLMISENGSNFATIDDIAVTSNILQTDYVETNINQWITSIKYQSYDDDIPTYYGMAEVIIYTDDNPPEMVPEPFTILSIICGLIGLRLYRGFVKE